MNNSFVRLITSPLRHRMFRPMFLVFYRNYLRAGTWQEDLLLKVTPRTDERILVVGAESCNISEALARNNPQCEVAWLHIGPGPAKQRSSSNKLRLLSCDHFKIQHSAASYHKVICAMSLHSLVVDQKLAFLRELRRVLRHGGTLYLADFDKPVIAKEGGALGAIEHLFGLEAIKPHLDGSWVKLIEHAGFVSVRRLRSTTDIIGRTAILKARRG